jgi:hypothetical protein
LLNVPLGATRYKSTVAIQRGRTMQTVKLDRAGGIAQAMTDMRTWLDQNGIEPISFQTRPSRRGNFRIELRFSRSDQASRFAEAFRKSVTTR